MESRAPRSFSQLCLPLPLCLARWGIELRVLTLEPRLVVVRVFDLQRRLRHLKRTKAVHHNRELVGVLGADACLGASWVGAVGDAIRMVGDAAEFDSLSAHEFARGVVKHFI